MSAVLLIDEQDIGLLSNFSWSDNGNGYWRAYDATTGKHVYLHRLIARARPGEIVDHANRDISDCTRRNLRIVTKSQNGVNCKKHASSKGWPQSIYRGVSWHPTNNKWTASYKNKYLGSFVSDVDAAKAYDAAVDAAGDIHANKNFAGESDHVRH